MESIDYYNTPVGDEFARSVFIYKKFQGKSYKVSLDELAARRFALVTDGRVRLVKGWRATRFFIDTMIHIQPHTYGVRLGQTKNTFGVFVGDNASIRKDGVDVEITPRDITDLCYALVARLDRALVFKSRYEEFMFDATWAYRLNKYKEAYKNDIEKFAEKNKAIVERIKSTYQSEKARIDRDYMEIKQRLNIKEHRDELIKASDKRENDLEKLEEKYKKDVMRYEYDPDKMPFVQSIHILGLQDYCYIEEDFESKKINKDDFEKIKRYIMSDWETDKKEWLDEEKRKFVARQLEFRNDAWAKLTLEDKKKFYAENHIAERMDRKKLWSMIPYDEKRRIWDNIIETYYTNIAKMDDVSAKKKAVCRIIRNVSEHVPQQWQPIQTDLPMPDKYEVTKWNRATRRLEKQIAQTLWVDFDTEAIAKFEKDNLYKFAGRKCEVITVKREDNGHNKVKLMIAFVDGADQMTMTLIADKSDKRFHFGVSEKM